MEENRLNDQRRMWKYIVFGILTLGIYDLIFMWGLIRDLNRACSKVERDGEEENSPNYILVVLFTIFTLGIYNYVWYYKQGNRMKRAGREYGVEIDEKGGTYLLWILLGFWLFGVGPFVALYLFIVNLNKLCRRYNVRIQEEYQPGPRPENNWPNQEPQDRPAEVRKDSSSDMWNEDTYYDMKDKTTTKGINMTGRIRFISGAYSGAEVELQPGREMVLGRNSELSQLIIQDPDISRKHCSIRYSVSDGAYYVTDFSTFGVYINDSQRMEKNVEVRCMPGTKLTLGSGNNVFILQ